MIVERNWTQKTPYIWLYTCNSGKGRTQATDQGLARAMNRRRNISQKFNLQLNSEDHMTGYIY